MGAGDYLAQRLAGNLDFEPTPCQRGLFEAFSKFTLQTGEADIMVVGGYAGTGKTSALAAFVKTLSQLKIKFVLLAPTGRSAKVLSSFSGFAASTIHRHIYRQKSLAEKAGAFTLDINKGRDTFYIVDEASLIAAGSSEGALFGSGDLLSDLVSYVRSGERNKLILMGDSAQLPPVGMPLSPALDPSYMGMFGRTESASLQSVVRQAAQSGILVNATRIREEITRGGDRMPQLTTEGFDDVERIGGGDLIDAIGDAYNRYGSDSTVVLCRSNKRANRYNAGIRATILDREVQLVKGDRLMVVKNCYQFSSDNEELDFIANGDIARLEKISRYEERYGLHFAEARLSFPDYDDCTVRAKIVLDALHSEAPSLTREQQNALYEGTMADYAHIKGMRKRLQAVREDPYFNALQIKYAAAITCHKAQGGQWDCVFIDNPFWQETTADDLKWLYTAITRGVRKVFFVNFKDEFFQTRL